MIQVFVFKAVTVYHFVWEGRGHISAGISELASEKNHHHIRSTFTSPGLNGCGTKRIELPT